MKRLLPLLFSVAVTGGVVAGCGGPPPAIDGSNTSVEGKTPSSGAVLSVEEPPSEPGKYGGKITVSQVTDPKTFNPITTGETTSSDILAPVFEGLNNRNNYTLEMEPALAELPKISADGLTYTYVIKEGLKWSDGHPLTADDVIFSLEAILDPKVENIIREGMLIDVVDATGKITRKPFTYRKVDDRTVEFVLPQKFAPAVSTFSFPIAPKHKLETAYRSGKFNEAWGVNVKVTEVVGSGPWTIGEYAPGQRLVYKRNPNYWRKTADGKPLPYLDQEVVLFVGDVNAAVLKFQNKETDFLGVPSEHYPTLKKDESSGDYKVVDRGPGWGFEFLGFNMNPNSKLKKPLLNLFSDVRWRRAASHLVNRERMCEDVLRGLAEPAYGPVSPASRVYFKADVPKFEYNPEKAKALLDELGAKDTNGNGFREFQGQEIKFNILVYSGADTIKQMATIISEDMKKVGVNASFSPIDFNDLVRRLDVAPYDWEASMIGFTGGPEPHDGSNIWRSSGPSHQWWPKQKTPGTPWEKEIDELWTRGAQELDPAKRKEIYGRWQELVADQQPFVFTVVRNQNTAVRDRIGNFKPPSMRISTWNVYELFDREATRDNP